MYLDFQNIKPLLKAKNKPFFAVANLHDSQIKAWLGSDNLSMALRGSWVYIYTPKVNVEISCGMYFDFQNIKPLQKSQNKLFLVVANQADSQFKAWLGSDYLSMALGGPWPYIYTQKSL